MPLSKQHRKMIAGLVLASLLLLPAAVEARTDTTAKPLPLIVRVLRAGELPGFAPRERPTTVASAVAWNRVAPSGGIDLTARLRRAGFVAGVREDLEWKDGNDRGALSVAVRLGSAAAARAEIARELHDSADEPNRGKATAYMPFAVPGIPGAHGFSLPASDHAGHNIIFADGPFIYWAGVGWGNQVKDPPTRAQLIAATTVLYERVHGRPAP